MRLGMNMLSLSRPLVFLLMLSPYIISAGSQPFLALYVIAAAYFVASSAVIVGWIPAPDRWSARFLWGEIALGALLNGVTSHHGMEGPMTAAFSPVFVTLFLTFERRHWRRAVLVTTAAWLGSVWLTGWPPHNPLGTLAMTGMYTVLFLFSAGVGLLIRSLKDERDRSERLLREVTHSRAALERTHQQLVESAARQQEVAVLEERQRLAREMHDSVAHTLTALVVQTQVASRLLDRTPEQAREALRRSEEMAREALQETRQAVRALHPSGLEQQSELEALRRLGRDFGIATGMAVQVEADSAAAALPPHPERLEQLYRIFQEALTNAHRHGQARSVQATLRFDGEQLHLRVTNNGAVPRSLDPGVGLKSMQERARSLGGSVRFETGTAGLAVHVAVPVPKEAVS